MHHTVKPSSWFTIIVALYCLASFNPLSANQAHTHSENQPQETLDWNENNLTDAPIGGGVLELRASGIRTEALLLKTEIELDVNGLLADMRLTQQFTNSSNHWLEGVYLFPLPIDAAVHGMTIQVGERTIIGTIKTREDATITYEKAKQSGKVASLVEQQRPNMFTAKVANIAPGELISIRLDIMLPVNFDNAQFELLLPTTHTPRYVNTETPDFKNVLGPVAHTTEITGPQLSLLAHIKPVDTITQVSSPSHNLSYMDTAIAIDEASMDRDLVLTWPVPTDFSPLGEIYTTRFAGDRYMQLMIAPPSDALDQPRTSRELVLIIDKSGSMAGEPMRAAKRALLSALDGLEETDHFNIVAFDNHALRLFDSAQVANGENINQAKRFIRGLHADGGTEMEDAIRFALRSNNPDRLRQLVFVTDGSVGYEDTLLRTIRREIGDSRLFTVGIGSAPNRFFLEKAAEAGRGTSVSIMNMSVVQQQMDTLLDKLEHPALTQFDLQFIGGHGEYYPHPIPDLYKDEPLMLVAKLDDQVTSINLSGWQADTQISNEFSIPSSGDSNVSSIARHWARKKIANLTDEQRFSHDNDKNQTQITDVAMTFGLASKYTSFIAVEQQPIRPSIDTLQTANIANLMPAGAEMESVLMPMGSASSDTLALLSLLFGFTGIALWTTAWRLGLLLPDDGEPA